jgi:hypothetical protein
MVSGYVLPVAWPDYAYLKKYTTWIISVLLIIPNSHGQVSANSKFIIASKVVLFDQEG